MRPLSAGRSRPPSATLVSEVSASSANQCSKRWPNSRQPCTTSPCKDREIRLRNPAQVELLALCVSVAPRQPSAPSGDRGRRLP